MPVSADVDPIAILEDFARRARSGATDVPDLGTPTRSSLGVGVRAAGERMIVPLAEVQALVELEHCTHVPGTQPWLRGVSHAGGRLVSVVDLTAFLSAQGPSEEAASWLICLLGDDAPIALSVDEVIGLTRFPEEVLTQRLSEDDQAWSPFLAGVWRDQEDVWRVLDVQALRGSSRFLQVAR